MKTKTIVLIVLALAVAIGAVVFRRWSRQSEPASRRAAMQQPSPIAGQLPESNAATAQVPAHYEAAPSADQLAPTLPPEKFNGQIRAAYQAAREIPQTIAQMPCYCHCDMSLGHKSLHSCFEDDHAAHCAVCTGEALMAYQLQKQGLTPKQIRDRIVAEYSRQ
jgi:uncharacterized iron-regulated membrane protein